MRLVAFLITVLCFTHASSQNLAPNPSFESFSSSIFCDYWSNVNSTATPDFNHTSFTGPRQLPNNIMADIYPRTGNGACGIGAYVPTGWREYITAQLPAPLIKGAYYDISYWVCNGDSNIRGGMSCNNLGFNLSQSKMNQPSYWPFSIEPTYHDTTEIWTTSWYKIGSTVKVNDNFRWITLGNFHSQANTNYTVWFPAPSIHASAYYFIDDVEITLKYPIIDTARICLGDSVLLSPNGDTSYTWVVDEITPSIIGNDTSIYVSPTRTTTFMKISAVDTSLFIIYVDSFPEVNFGQDTALCDGQLISLDATNSNATYLWQDGSNYHLFTVLQSGRYWVEVNRNGCIQSDTINISFNPNPVADLGGDTSLCTGDSLILKVNPSGASVTWQDNSTDSMFVVDQDGNYSVSVNLNGCVKNDNINVSFYDYPRPNLGSDTSLCAGDHLVLSAYDSNATNYLWQDGQTTITYYLNQSGLYWVELTNPGGCIGSDSITVNVKESPQLDFGENEALCDGEEMVLDAFNLNATYSWHDGSDSSAFLVSDSGKYWVEVNLENCLISDTVMIIIQTMPFVDLGSDTTICEGEVLSLDASLEDASYYWKGGATAPILYVTDEGEYWVDVKKNNCIASDTIRVFTSNCTPVLIMPNVITPNNDGINDMFIPFQIKYIESATTYIYNKWGGKIFETSNPKIEWDGKGVSDGTYFYLIDYTDKDGVKNNLRGYVTILR